MIGKSMNNKRPRGTMDRGQAVPFMVLVLLTAMALLFSIARVAPLVDDAARARTAADSAALAGAAEGRDEAERQAGLNGGELVRFERSGSTVTVTVSVGAANATARAQASIQWVRGTEGD